MSKTALVSNLSKVNHEVNKNSPAILVILGLVGMASTVVMACKATPKAKDILDDLHGQQAELGEEVSKPKQVFMDVKAVAPVYLPAALMGGLSTACILSSYSISAKRTAAFATAYDISQRSLKTYQEKVIETIGGKKEEKIRDEIAKDKLHNNYTTEDEIYNTGNGDMLFLDGVTGAMYRTSIDSIRKAESVLNRRLYTEMFVSLNEFYDEIGVPHCGIGDDIGWDVDNEIDFLFSSQITQDMKTCMVLEYLVAPRYDYRSLS